MLIADDEPQIVAMLDEYFSGLGFRVVCARDGSEALKKAACGPDIVLLDVGMPGIDGFEACRRLRERLCCPIVFLTARVEDADALTGFEAGADDYVLKPFSLAVLGARVRSHLARERRRADRAQVRFVSVNAFLANSTNEPAPIAPSKRRRFRQRKPAASG